MLSPRGPEVPSQLLSTIYEAASDPARWPDVVAQCAHWSGGEVASLQARRLGERQDTLLLSTAIESRYMRAYETHYSGCDPHLARVGRLPVGRTLLSREVLSSHELERTEYYNDFCRPQGLRDLQGLLLVRNPHWVVALAMFGREGEEFNEETRGRLDVLAPHLTRALSLGFRFEEPGGGEPALALASRTRLVGRLHVDRELRVVHGIEKTTEDLLNATDAPLTIEQRKLRGRTRGDHGLLQQAVARAYHGEPVTLCVGTGAAKLMLGVAPGPRLSPITSERCMTVMFSPRHGSEHELAATRFNALPASLRPVAESLAQGCTDKEIAEQLGLSTATARTYVARVLKRLQMSRRELMRALNQRTGPQL